MKLTPLMTALALCALLVLAAGGGGGGGGSSRSPPAPPPEPPKPDCESMAGMQERVQCRLEQNLENKGLPEACRGLANERSCQDLYDRSLPCYGQSDLNEDRCLRGVSGLSKSQGKQEIRQYLVLLLYKLEERVEERYEEGKISSKNAALLITRITELKRKVLTNESKEKLEPALAALKQDWKRLMA